MTECDAPYGQLARSFAEIARTLSSDPTVHGTLQRIVELAVATVDGCDAAGISLLMGGVVTTPAYSHPIALEVDVLQYETTQGPCLDAITKSPVVYAEDLASDMRWPDFGPRATTLGMNSLLSCRLFSTVTLGALNLYARSARAYSMDDRTNALVFAAHAGVALSAAGALEDAATSLSTELLRGENLRSAMTTREIIGQAEGILIERERTTADHAFAILRRASQHLNIKLREVAQYLVDTGELPSR